jgi:CheY-like chemotaxis protein
MTVSRAPAVAVRSDDASAQGVEDEFMSEDLVSLRMLVVSPSSPDRDTWRQAVGLAPMPIEFFEADDLATARQQLARGVADIVVLDAAMLEPERSAVAGAARAAASTPFVIVSAYNDSVARGVDADGVVTKPSSVAEAQYLIDRVAHVRVPIHVLVVDDSSTMRSIVRKILTATRFPVVVGEAEEGAAALARIREDKFDVVILDYNMPGLNGLDTLAEIKRDHQRLEVVMISSTQDDAVASRVRSAGAAAFLKKPFFPADIDVVLHAFCGMRPAPG